MIAVVSVSHCKLITPTKTPAITSSPSLSSCTEKLPNGAENPCWKNGITPTYKWDSSATVCLQNTTCVRPDGLTCMTKTTSSSYCSPIPKITKRPIPKITNRPTLPSQASCTEKLPNGAENPCYTFKGTYELHASVCTKLTGCVLWDGTSCTVTDVAGYYCALAPTPKVK
jgi:hypothetical protein